MQVADAVGEHLAQRLCRPTEGATVINTRERGGGGASLVRHRFDSSSPDRDTRSSDRDACSPDRDACSPDRDACSPDRDACSPDRDVCSP